MKKLLIPLLVLLCAVSVQAQVDVQPIGTRSNTVQAQNNLQSLGWLAPGIFPDTPAMVSGIPMGALITRLVDSTVWRFNGVQTLGVSHWIKWGGSQGATGVTGITVNGGATQSGLVALTVPTDVGQLTNTIGYITAAQAPVRSVNGNVGNIIIDGSETKISNSGANTTVTGAGTITSPYVVSANTSGGTRNADTLMGGPIDTSTRVQGYALVYDTAGRAANGVGKWKLVPNGSSTTLASLGDVTLTALANGQLLQYNSSTTKWVNFTPAYLTTITGITAGGDLSGTYPNPTVAKLNALPASYYLDYTHLVNTPTIANVPVGGNYAIAIPTTTNIKGLLGRPARGIILDSLTGNIIGFTADTNYLSTILGVHDSLLVFRGTTYGLHITQYGQGFNPLGRVNDSTIAGKVYRDSLNATLVLNGDSSLTTVVPFPTVLPMRNDSKITITNNHVYEGNSITAGATLPSPSTQAYPVLINDTMVLTATTNRAISNSTWLDMLSRQLALDPVGQVTYSYSIMGGENNFGEDTSILKYIACREALRTSIANHFMDSAWAINNAYVTKTGTWANITSANLVSKSQLTSSGQPMKSSILGNTLTFTIFDNTVVIGTYAWKTGDNYGSAAISIDGKGMINPATGVNVWTGQNQASHFTSQIGTYDTRLPLVWVFSNLGIGAHTVVITLLQNLETDFDYVGKLVRPQQAAGMLVFHVTKRGPSGYFSYSDVGGGPTGIDSINRNMDTVINTFRTMGMPIATAHTNEYLNLSMFYTDWLHFLPSGHVALASSALAGIQRATSGGGGGTTDTTHSTSPTAGSIGYESIFDKYLLQHPTYFKNVPLALRVGDTLGYKNLDTIYWKTIIMGYGLSDSITQTSVKPYLDTTKANIHTTPFNDARYLVPSYNFVDTILHLPDSVTLRYHYHNGTFDDTKFNTYITSGGSVSVGAIDSLFSANGLTVTPAGRLIAQYASGSNPGMIKGSGSQTIGATLHITNAPSFLSSSTAGQVWTANNSTGQGTWQTPVIQNISSPSNTLTVGAAPNISLDINLAANNTWSGITTLNSPVLAGPSVIGQVWTATNTAGAGVWSSVTTPNLQQVLTAGSNLTSGFTVNGGANGLTFTNFSALTLASNSNINLNGGVLFVTADKTANSAITVGTGDYYINITSSVSVTQTITMPTGTAGRTIVIRNESTASMNFAGTTIKGPTGSTVTSIVAGSTLRMFYSSNETAFVVF